MSRNNRNRTVNNEMMRSYEEKLRESKMNFASLKQEMQRNCNHVHIGGKGAFPISETNLNVSNKKLLSADTMGCTSCEAIFSGRKFSPEELDEVMLVMNGVIEQTKLLNKNNSQDDEFITRLYDASDNFRTAFKFYLSLTNQMGNNNNNANRGNNNQQSVNIGIRMDQYNRRYN